METAKPTRSTLLDELETMYNNGELDNMWSIGMEGQCKPREGILNIPQLNINKN